jgi:hypothetical protein
MGTSGALASCVLEDRNATPTNPTRVRWGILGEAPGLREGREGARAPLVCVRVDVGFLYRHGSAASIPLSKGFCPNRQKALLILTSNFPTRVCDVVRRGDCSAIREWSPGNCRTLPEGTMCAESRLQRPIVISGCNRDASDGFSSWSQPAAAMSAETALGRTVSGDPRWTGVATAWLLQLRSQCRLGSYPQEV